MTGRVSWFWRRVGKCIMQANLKQCYATSNTNLFNRSYLFQIFTSFFSFAVRSLRCFGPSVAVHRHSLFITAAVDCLTVIDCLWRAKHLYRNSGFHSTQLVIQNKHHRSLCTWTYDFPGSNCTICWISNYTRKIQQIPNFSNKRYSRCKQTVLLHVLSWCCSPLCWFPALHNTKLPVGIEYFININLKRIKGRLKLNKLRNTTEMMSSMK